MPLSRLTLLLLFLPLGACGSLLTETTADVSGIAGAGIAGAITKDATVGAAIGLGVRSVAAAGLRYAERRVHRAEQDTIAAVAGVTPTGRVAAWHIEHDIPVEEDEHGQVVVAREFGAEEMACKEIVFSVDGEPGKTGGSADLHRAFYTATVCRDGQQWKWASAEPATERWGSLQ